MTVSEAIVLHQTERKNVSKIQVHEWLLFMTKLVEWPSTSPKKSDRGIASEKRCWKCYASPSHIRAKWMRVMNWKNILRLVEILFSRSSLALMLRPGKKQWSSDKNISVFYHTMLPKLHQVKCQGNVNLFHQCERKCPHWIRFSSVNCKPTFYLADVKPFRDMARRKRPGLW